MSTHARDALVEVLGSTYANNEVVSALERALEHTDDPHVRIGLTNALTDAQGLRRRLRTLANVLRGFG